MKIFIRVCAIAVSVGLGLVFLYSGYTKLLPIIEAFELSFIDLHVANWYTAPVIARLVIGLELFTGFLLITNFRLKQFTLPLATVVLLLFTVYLAIIIVVNGDSGNCGCFGERLPMTPFKAILKNVVMIAGCIGVYKVYEGWQFRRNSLFISLVSVTAGILPFLINPLDYDYTSNNLDEEINYPLQLDLLYQPDDTSNVQVPTVDLRKCKHVVAFLSLTCSHCRTAAKKFRLIHRNNPSLPIYFVLNGKRSHYADFIKETRAGDIPYSFCLGKTFIHFAAAQLPRIYYLENGLVVKKVDYLELSQYDIEDWINSSERN